MKDDYLQRFLKEKVELYNKITAYHAVLCDHNLLDEAEKQAKEFEKMLNSECPCEEGIDSKDCGGCPQDEERKVHCENCQTVRDANGVCYLSADGRCKNGSLFLQKKKTYRPFKDCDELVKYWTEKYQSVARPAFTMPLVWVKKKEGGSVCLITGYDNGDGGWGSCVFLEDVWIDLKELFDDFEFLDKKPCGKENEE